MKSYPIESVTTDQPVYTFSPSLATYDLIVLSAEASEPVIRIKPDGRLFWHGREVESDDDFKASMLELAEYFCGRFPKATP